MEFFVPGASADEAEEVYAAMAALCRNPVPPPGKRIQRITFQHNSADWIAAVGEQLRGTKTMRRRRQGRMVDVTTRLSDPATVRAIFSGDPFLVVTDARPYGEVISGWVNPFFAGGYVGVTHFDSPQPIEPATPPAADESI